MLPILNHRKTAFDQSIVDHKSAEKVNFILNSRKEWVFFVSVGWEIVDNKQQKHFESLIMTDDARRKKQKRQQQKKKKMNCESAGFLNAFLGKHLPFSIYCWVSCFS